MIKKGIYTFVTLLIGINVNYILIKNSNFNVVIFLISLIFYSVGVFGLFFPNKLFKITHWYLKQELSECTDSFIVFYKGLIIIMVFLAVVAPIYQMAPFDR